MGTAMPAGTSAWLLKQAHSYLTYLQHAYSKVFLPNQFAASAAMIQAFVNGAIGVRLPSKEWWIQAYSDDMEMSTIHVLITKFSKINNSTLSMVNFNYPPHSRTHRLCSRMKCQYIANLSAGVLPTLACNLLLLHFITSS